MSERVSFQVTVSASPQWVYAAFTQPALLNQWLSDSNRVNAHVGGSFLLTWNSGYFAVGEYTALEPNQRIAFTWQGRGDSTLTNVDVQIEPAENDASLVTLTHNDLPEATTWTNQQREIIEGWEDALERLKHLLEVGHDLRLIRRPILGITTEPADAGPHEQTGQKIEGIRIQGMMADSAAERDGLLPRDVIVKLNGVPVRQFSDFAAALRNVVAGQPIPVELYRGGELRTLTLRPASRSVPPLSETLEDLIERFENANREAITELRELVEGQDERLLTAQPAPREWSVVEVLAHLVWSERHAQFSNWSLAAGEDYVPWPNNGLLQLRGILQAYPTSQELLTLLEKTLQETEGQLLGLQEDAFLNRSLVAYLSGMAEEARRHIREHLLQIRSAIDAARETINA
jgi:uncharacterized protein YndB with AHSA1/START domain